MADKRKWVKPELIALVRGRPEETVALALCKTGRGIPDSYGPGNFDIGCFEQTCYQCVGIVNT